jgi:hypothetical protein
MRKGAPVCITLRAQLCTSSKYALLPKLTIRRLAVSKSGGCTLAGGGGRGGFRAAARSQLWPPGLTTPPPAAPDVPLLPISDSWPGSKRLEASRCASLQRACWNSV